MARIDDGEFHFNFRLYPVDKKRVNEFGATGEEDSDKKQN